MNTPTTLTPQCADWPVGSHLVTPRRGYAHHGIYVGGGRVIHYAGFSRHWWRGPIEEVSLDRFRNGQPVHLVDTEGARHCGERCARRARRRLGENQFSVWTNNCEHFCSWCLHGISRSAQVEALRARARALISRIGQWFACMPIR